MKKNENQLWKHYKKTKDPKTRETFILEYAPLVRGVAGRVARSTPPNIEFDDLVSYGILGLIDAIEKYDPSQGIEFKAYAATRIKGSILDELCHMDWVPRSVRKRARKIEQAYMELEHRLSRPATDDELADYFGVDEKKLAHLFFWARSPAQVSQVSMEKDMNKENVAAGDEKITAEDTLRGPASETPDAILERGEAKKLLIAAIERLPQREGEVLVLYYYKGLKIKEVGEVLGVSESRISQIHKKAIMRLRVYLGRTKKMSTQATMKQIEHEYFST
ncbi:FliA/WhiG family RNA polymerase sigma factor [Patescibacteria group bacterium]|nr:FliA/WhiG family RNA polymerase sigma factor [Patescibacteria group bacterium]